MLNTPIADRSSAPSRSRTAITEAWLKAPLPSSKASETLHQRIMREVEQTTPARRLPYRVGAPLAAAAALVLVAAGVWTTTRPPPQPMASLPTLHAGSSMATMIGATEDPYVREMERLRADMAGVVQYVGTRLSAPAL